MAVTRRMLQLVLHALSFSPATPQELDLIEGLVDEIRMRSETSKSSRARRSLPRGTPSSRVVPYSQPIVGLGELHGNASIVQGPRVSTTGPSTRFPAQMPPVAAPAVPTRARRISARGVSFSGHHAGDERRFRLEERTTEFDDGTSTRDYVWVRGRYVVIVAVSDGGVVFVRQYKKAAQQTLLVLPWGEIERDESPLEAGRRELEEETGYSYRRAEVYGPFYDLPDKSTGGHWVVVARNAYPKTYPAPDEGELISGIELIGIRELWRHHIPVLMHLGALLLAGL